jgi:hypothetical protein
MDSKLLSVENRGRSFWKLATLETRHTFFAWAMPD